MYRFNKLNYQRIFNQGDFGSNMYTYSTAGGGGSAASKGVGLASSVGGGAAMGSAMGPVGTAVGAAAGLFAGLAGMFGSDPAQQTAQRLVLPPELELDMLNRVNQNMQRLQSGFSQIDTLTREYTQRLNLVDQAISGQIPSNEVQKQLADSSARIAAGLGLSGEELVKNGFLTNQDLKDLETIKGIESKTLDELSQQSEGINKQKQQLTQQLLRSGASPAVIQQALNDFTSTAIESVRNRAYEDIHQRTALRESGLNQTLSMQQGLQSELGRINQLNQSRLNLGQNILEAGVGGVNLQNQLSQSMLDQYNQVGQYKLSKRTNRAIARGEVGPGSYQAQLAEFTGIPLNTRFNLGDRYVNEGMQGVLASAAEDKERKKLLKQKGFV